MRAPLVLFAALLLSVAPVAAQGLTASYTISPEAPEEGDVVTFTSTSTAGTAPIVLWNWTFGDGFSAQGEVVTHGYEAGNWILTLVVTDDNGATDQDQSLLVVNEPQVEQVSLVTGGSSLPDWMFWVMPFLVAVLLFSMAYLVVAKGQPAIYNQVFLFFYVTAGIKSLSEAAMFLLAGSDAFVKVQLFNRFTGYLLVAFFLWFVLVFPRPIVAWLRDGRRGAVALLLAVPFMVVDFGGLLDVAAAENAFNVFAITVAAASLVLLFIHSRETDSEEEKLRIRWLAATFLLLVVSTVAITVMQLLYSGAIGDGEAQRAQSLANLTAMTVLVVVPALEIVGAMILLYAILRYQALGIEGLVLRVTRGAVTALTVPSLFITIGNSVEALFEATVLSGVRFSFIIAGFISALLMIPLQKWITFLLHRFLPSLDRETAAETHRRKEIFEAQLRYCLLDGDLKAHEVLTLRKLAAQLHMPADDLRSILGRFKGSELGGLVDLKARPT